MKMPPLDDDDLELWLNLLVDDELSPEQRRELIQYLNRHPEYWRICARTFLDQQTLQNTIVQPVGESNSGITRKVVPGSKTEKMEVAGQVVVGLSRVELRSRQNVSRSRRMTRWLAMAGCIALTGCCGFLAGAWGGIDWGRQESKRELDQAAIQIAQLERNLDKEQRFGAMLASLGTSPQCELVNRFQGQPMLIELENTPSHALYLTNREVPRSLLDCFASAGFGVEIKLYEPKFMNPFKSPVVALEVTKRSAFNLLASGESQ